MICFLNTFFDRKYRLPRIWSNKEIRKLAPFFKGDIINISAWEDRDKEGDMYKHYFTNCSSYIISNYSGHRGFIGKDNEIFLDLTQPVPPGLVGRFDVCFNHTTLEHIFDVRKAFSTICTISRDIVFILVPFCQEQHELGEAKDFWRFTPTCMRYMFKENGLEIVYEAQSPYKNAGIYLVFVGSKFPEKWRGSLPQFEPIQKSGSWIGHNFLAEIRKHLTGY